MTTNIRQPSKIPKEPAFWTGTLLSIVFHACLVGAIWMTAMHRDGNPMLPKAVSQNSASGVAIAKTEAAASSAAAPARTSVLTGATESTGTGDVTSTPAKFKSAQTDIAAEPKTDIAPTATKYPDQNHVAALIENRKLVETQETKRKRTQALAKQRDKLKRAALAQQNSRKTIAEKTALSKKSRATAEATRVAANMQRQKQSNDEHAIEKLHQEEMRRLTSGSAGSG